MGTQTRDLGGDDWLEDDDGQLAIDVYQTDDQVIIKAPIAGVQPDNLTVTITDEVVTVEGERRDVQAVERANYFTQECYWGRFSRSFVLPVAVDADSAVAELRHGILTLRIPKQAKTRARSVKVTSLEE